MSGPGLRAFTVPPELAGARLDVALARLAPDLYGRTNFYERAIVDVILKSKGHVKSKIW